MSSVSEKLEELRTRRAALQTAYDDLLTRPASYNVSGSLSVTSQKPELLLAEIQRIDRQIARLLGYGGITRVYPDYRMGGNF